MQPTRATVTAVIGPRGRRRRARAAAATALACAALPGCAQPTANPLPDLRFQANTPIGSLVTHVSPVWTAALNPAGRTASTADTLIAIDLKDGGQPEAVALDLSSGRELWRHPAGVGAASGTTRLDAVVAKTPQGNDVTAYFAPAAAQAAGGAPQAPVRVVLADPRSGEVRQVEVPGALNLGTCRVVGGLCAEQMGARGERTPIRIDPVTGRAEPLKLPMGPLDRVVDLGGGVYTARRGTTTFVGRAGEGGWEKPVAEFVGTDVDLTSTLAWSHHEESTHELSLTVRRKPLADTDLRLAASDLFSTVIDTQVGEKLWDAPGVSLWCPGGATGVTCTGELAYTRKDRTSHTFTPVAGAVTYAALPVGGSDTPWQQKLREVTSPAGPEGTTLRTPGAMWVFQQGTRTQLGDLATGDLTPLDDSHWAACEASRTVAVGAARVTAATYRPCTTRILSPEPAQFTIAGVLAVAGTQPPGSVPEGVPGLYAVTMPDRVAVYR